MRPTIFRGLLATVAVAGIGISSVACKSDSDRVTVQHVQFGTLDPHTTFMANEISLHRMLFRGLYEFDRANQVQPELADGLPQITNDGKTYVIQLKKNLQWSDGDDLTSEDVVAGILHTCTPSTGAPYAQSLYNITGCEELNMSESKSASAIEELQANVGVKAVNPFTVEFTLEEPQATFNSQLALWYTWPIPVHLVEVGEEWPTDPADLAYSGPFKAGNYQEGESLELLRNEHFGADGGQLAKLESLTLRFIEDLETAQNAFQSGEVLAARADSTQVKALRDQFGDELVTSTEPAGTLGLQMMANKAPLDNPKLRLALSQATDRDALNDVVYGGASIPTTSWIPGYLIGTDEDVYSDHIGYDPEAAKKNFAEYGAPADLSLTITVRNGASEIQTMAQFLQEQWKQVLGINVIIDTVDPAEYRSILGGNDFQIVLSGWGQDYPDPENWVDTLFNSDGANNHFGCERQDLDTLLSKAKSNRDRANRIGEYRQINEKISKEICGMAPLIHNRAFTLVDSKLKGLKENTSGLDYFLAGDAEVEQWYLAD